MSNPLATNVKGTVIFRSSPIEQEGGFNDDGWWVEPSGEAGYKVEKIEGAVITPKVNEIEGVSQFAMGYDYNRFTIYLPDKELEGSPTKFDWWLFPSEELVESMKNTSTATLKKEPDPQFYGDRFVAANPVAWQWSSPFTSQSWGVQVDVERKAVSEP